MLWWCDDQFDPSFCSVSCHVMSSGVMTSCRCVVMCHVSCVMCHGVMVSWCCVVSWYRHCVVLYEIYVRHFQI